MKARIAGLGLWLPSTVRRNDDWPDELVARARERGDRTLVDVPPSGDSLDAITARHLLAERSDPFLGAHERRIATDEPAWLAETEAGRQALEDAGVSAADVDVVLSWSIVSDRASLPSATKVASELGCTRAWASGVDAGCASALTQLDLAAGMIESGRARVVLLTQSHLITRAFPMAHPASVGVGDCATAIVVTAAERRGVLLVEAASDGRYWDAVTWVREGDDAPWWCSGAAFGPGSKNRDGAKELMRKTVRYGVDTVRAACQREGYSPTDLDAVISVQPRGWIPPSIAEGLGLAPELAPTTYRELAHVGGCGVVANLLACRERGALKKGALVALYAQGAGFTRAAGLVRW